MTNKMERAPRWMWMAIMAMACLVSACADLFTPPPKPPGLYNLTGWGGWGADFDGEIGRPIWVIGPQANCRPSQQWSSHYRIISGQLPPGVYIRNDNYYIEGIPEDRGHYIVKLELYDILCGGTYYNGFTQELRFHITGSGRVVR